MKASAWLLTSVLLMAAGGAAVAGFNITADPYGLFHATKGREMVPYGDERLAKFLLSERYVPENFDSVMIGASVSANWDLSGIERFRVYNDSLNGSNAMEGRALLRQALSRPGIRTVFLLVHPAATATSYFPTVDMTPELRHAALGSLHLWNAYRHMLRVRFLHSKTMIDHRGRQDFGTFPSEMNADMKRMWKPGEDFFVDERAMKAFQDTIAMTHERKLQLVFVVPPIYEPILDGKRAAFANYLRRIGAEKAPADEWIDFTGEEYLEFRKTRSNFGDGVHFLPPAAKMVVSYLNSEVNDRVASGRLRSERREQAAR